jgi:hypothetical protein
MRPFRKKTKREAILEIRNQWILTKMMARQT